MNWSEFPKSTFHRQAPKCVHGFDGYCELCEKLEISEKGGLLKDMVKNLEPLEVYKLDQFRGMRLIVDPNLPDNRWYMAVSADIWKALQETDEALAAKE